MAYKQRTGMTAATQFILTDDPDFLQFIVERVIQEVLDAVRSGEATATATSRVNSTVGERVTLSRDG